MIDEHSIRRKDFSIDLYLLVKKVHFLGEAIGNGNDNTYLAEGQNAEGLGAILCNIADDLNIIWEALYQNETAQPEATGSTI